jgi:hypothetical protein
MGIGCSCFVVACGGVGGGDGGAKVVVMEQYQ